MPAKTLQWDLSEFRFYGFQWGAEHTSATPREILAEAFRRYPNEETEFGDYPGLTIPEVRPAWVCGAVEGVALKLGFDPRKGE